MARAVIDSEHHTRFHPLNSMLLTLTRRRCVPRPLHHRKRCRGTRGVVRKVAQVKKRMQRREGFVSHAYALILAVQAQCSRHHQSGFFETFASTSLQQVKYHDHRRRYKKLRHKMNNELGRSLLQSHTQYEPAMSYQKSRSQNPRLDGFRVQLLALITQLFQLTINMFIEAELP